MEYQRSISTIRKYMLTTQGHGKTWENTCVHKHFKLAIHYHVYRLAKTNALFHNQMFLNNKSKKLYVSQQAALRRTSPQFIHLTNIPNIPSTQELDEIHATVRVRCYHHRHPCPCRRSEGEGGHRPNDKNCLLDTGSVNHSGGNHLENFGISSTTPPRISKTGIPKACFV